MASPTHKEKDLLIAELRKEIKRLERELARLSDGARKGGKKSKRTLTPEERKKLSAAGVAARKKKQKKK